MSFVLSVIYALSRKIGLYAECCYAECLYAECRGASLKGEFQSLILRVVKLILMTVQFFQSLRAKELRI